MARTGPAIVAMLMLSVCVPPVAASEAESVARGRLIASGGGPGGPADACFRCHGMTGEGQTASGFPRIAALRPDYLKKQLDDYASAIRLDAVMTPIARRLDDDDRMALAKYFAAVQPADSYAPPLFDAGLIQHGGAVYARGLPGSGVQACIDCHGVRARGLPPDNPALAGQDRTYVALQLRLWRGGMRNNDAGGVMARVAQRMSERDIEAVAEYLAALGRQ